MMSIAVVSARTARGGLAYISKTLAAGPPKPPASSSSSSSSSSATAPQQAPPAATVLFAHANGFCKECFLPLWDELAAAAAASPRPLPGPVRLVAFDFSGHGDSPPVSGPDCDWRRVAAGDVKAMLEEVAGGGVEGEGSTQGQCCYLGVGHSLGGAAMVIAELMQAPHQHQHALFNGGLVLVEPILLSPDDDRSMIHPLADRALKRRTSWPSRAAAREYLQPRPMFAAWDPRALDCYVEHALAGDSKNGEEVTLKCRPETEAGFYRGAGPSVWPDLHRLGHRRHPPVLFVAGAESDHMRVLLREKGSATAVARELVGMMGENSRLHVVRKVSHFLPMECPKLVAGLVWEQLLAALEAGHQQTAPPRSLL